jgi:hypothetical protein
VSHLKELSLRSHVALGLLLFHVIVAHAGEEQPRPVYGAHPGYLFDVDNEKNRREVEMVMLEQPKDKPKPLKEVIFNEKLSKEFQDQYRIKFGQTYAEQIVNSPSRDGDYQYSGRTVSVQDYMKYQRQFGEYMGRRLTEFHVDNWFKNDPQLRPVYELKDKFSNLNVEFKKSYKLVWKYNLSGPSMEASLENPYDIQTRVQVLMSGLVSKPTNVIYTLGYKFTPRVSSQALYRDLEHLYQLVCSRQMSKHIIMSITGSSGFIPDIPDRIYQNLILLGFAYYY